MGQKRKIPSKRTIKDYWAPRLVELDKFDSVEEVEELDYCFACGFHYRTNPFDEQTERAHIQPHCEGGSDDVSNIHLLCSACHDMSEGFWGDEYWKWFSAQNLFNVLFYLAAKHCINILNPTDAELEIRRQKSLEWCYTHLGYKAVYDITGHKWKDGKSKGSVTPNLCADAIRMDANGVAVESIVVKTGLSLAIVKRILNKDNTVLLAA